LSAHGPLRNLDGIFRPVSAGLPLTDIWTLLRSRHSTMMFKPSSPLFSGLLWKIPWRISQPQKARQRKRLRAVDKVVDVVSAALARNGQSTKAVDRWFKEMPREEEMLPRDKYTLFDKKEKTYRKGIHKLPKWTRVSQRVNPPGF
ncbi:mitochondrial ribosomal protein L31-domain-containing protein, partial [Aspergillus multicolor]|uniref:mitochondrial ribosomal protein L31-domain-containing protein n=1 Tax=Aspergillus multicolor TaxID=41759 RepID=UPI003CCE410D